MIAQEFDFKGNGNTFKFKTDVEYTFLVGFNYTPTYKGPSVYDFYIDAGSRYYYFNSDAVSNTKFKVFYIGFTDPGAFYSYHALSRSSKLIYQGY